MLLGSKHSEETIRKYKETRKGRKLTQQHKDAIGKGNKGKKITEETRKRLSIAQKNRKNFDIRGSKNPHWKGGVSSDKEYLRKLAKKWGLENYEKKIQYSKNSRVKKFGNGGFHSNEEWQTLKAQYNWTCPSCKKPEPEIKLTIDHIIALSKGGSDNIENIQPLCGKCNSRKYNKTIKYAN